MFSSRPCLLTDTRPLVKLTSDNVHFKTSSAVPPETEPNQHAKIHRKDLWITTSMINSMHRKLLLVHWEHAPHSERDSPSNTTIPDRYDFSCCSPHGRLTSHDHKCARGKQNTLTACSAALPSYSPSFQRKKPIFMATKIQEAPQMAGRPAPTATNQKNKKARTDGPTRHGSWLAFFARRAPLGL